MTFSVSSSFRLAVLLFNVLCLPYPSPFTPAENGTTVVVGTNVVGIAVVVGIANDDPIDTGRCEELWHFLAFDCIP